MNMWKIIRAVNAGRREETMPHVIVEYSANIEAEITPQRLVEEIHAAGHHQRHRRAGRRCAPG
jgi:hypothetical protein